MLGTKLSARETVLARRRIDHRVSPMSFSNAITFAWSREENSPSGETRAERRCAVTRGAALAAHLFLRSQERGDVSRASSFLSPVIFFRPPCPRHTNPPTRSGDDRVARRARGDNDPSALGPFLLVSIYLRHTPAEVLCARDIKFLTAVFLTGSPLSLYTRWSLLNFPRIKCN